MSFLPRRPSTPRTPTTFSHAKLKYKEEVVAVRGKYFCITVREGDDLPTIAELYDLRWQDIISMNIDIVADCSMVRPGMVLKVPCQEDVVQVSEGSSWASLAAASDQDEESLIAANSKIHSSFGDNLPVGLYLRLPPPAWRLQSDSSSPEEEYSEKEGVCARISTLFLNPLLADITFEVGPDSRRAGRLTAHRCVLASASSELRQLVCEAPPEPTALLRLRHFSVATFTSLLQYIYTGTVSLSASRALEVLEAAVSYNLPGLKLFCEEHIRKSIDVEHVCELYEAAKRYEASDLSEACLEFMDRHAGAVLAHEKMLLLSRESMQEVLRRDQLDIDELSLFHAVVRWGRSRVRFPQRPRAGGSLSVSITDLLAYIRLPLIGAEGLKGVRQLNVVPHESMMEAYECLLSPPDQLISHPLMRPRKGSIIPAPRLPVDALNTSGNFSSSSLVNSPAALSSSASFPALETSASLPASASCMSHSSSSASNASLPSSSSVSSLRASSSAPQLDTAPLPDSSHETAPSSSSSSISASSSSSSTSSSSSLLASADLNNPPTQASSSPSTSPVSLSPSTSSSTLPSSVSTDVSDPSLPSSTTPSLSEAEESKATDRTSPSAPISPNPSSTNLAESESQVSSPEGPDSTPSSSSAVIDTPSETSPAPASDASSSSPLSSVPSESLPPASSS